MPTWSQLCNMAPTQMQQTHTIHNLRLEVSMLRETVNVLSRDTLRQQWQIMNMANHLEDLTSRQLQLEAAMYLPRPQ